MAEQWAAGKPIIGFEQDLGSGQSLPDHGRRRSRFFQVYQARGGGNSVGTPMFMIDSGRDIKNGSQGNADKMRQVYGQWFDEAMARPAKAHIDAWWQRAGATNVTLRVDVTNISDAPFDPWEDDSALVVIMYDESPDVAYKGTVRWGRRIPLDDVVAPGGFLSQTIDLADVNGVNFRDVKVVVMLEYKVAGEWDQAQAALASEGDGPAEPVTLAITRPASGVRVPAGQDIVLEAELTGAETDKVAYYAGDAWLGEAEAPPWRVTWNDGVAGTFRVTAEAVVRGEVVVSAPIEVTILAAAAPTEPPPGPTEPAVDPPPGGSRPAIYLPLSVNAAPIQ